ncbi:MAG: NAD(P)H-hydrate dehydratase [Micavibrio aeruginosavorus]|uniref:ADP-dependent (S)-NAD(P)H-hydrate dehydratase n=1 Tax=Micavibrio aeruginosavorus TaxID=349221 RepID=A0A2W4ZYC3_9BACT|nr:MAG: NAD(P)H-hydrate dehydratase [Micavibrio aeruginosavorus]
MSIRQNDPSLWRDMLPAHDPKGHKYGRGVAVIYGAPKMTGATRLAARACARIGAGLVRVIAPEGTGDIYRSTLHEEIIVEDISDFKGFSDERIKAVLMGSGCMAGDLDDGIVANAFARPRVNGIILDAGAIGHADRFHGAVITPHEGEFSKTFPDIRGDKVAQAEEGARRIKGTVVLKGARTVIAGPDGVIVQDRDVPELATAGTGDVLAGMITGLMAQGMATPWAAAAAVWMHAEAASRFGRGMVASDLPEMLPAVLQDLS